MYGLDFVFGNASGERGIERAEHQFLGFQLLLQGVEPDPVVDALFYEFPFDVSGNILPYGRVNDDDHGDGDHDKAAQGEQCP